MSDRDIRLFQLEPATPGSRVRASLDWIPWTGGRKQRGWANAMQAGSVAAKKRHAGLRGPPRRRDAPGECAS
jgi:hypothetical protein